MTIKFLIEFEALSTRFYENDTGRFGKRKFDVYPPQKLRSGRKYVPTTNFVDGSRADVSSADVFSPVLNSTGASCSTARIFSDRLCRGHDVSSHSWLRNT